MKEMLSSVSPKGQITIPVAIRRLLGVKPKDTVAFYQRWPGDYQPSPLQPGICLWVT